MAKLIDQKQFPPELLNLLPENNRQAVVVGEQAYWMYPLPEGKVEKLSRSIAKILVGLSKAVKKSDVKEKSDKDEEEVQKGLIETFFSPEVAPAIIAEILDISVTDAQTVTLPQVAHIGGVFFDQNFSDRGIPEESRKNLDSLLVKMGLRKPVRAADQYQDALLRVVAQMRTTEGEAVPKTALMTQIQAALDPQQYTIFFPPNTDGPESTSLGSVEPSANLPASVVTPRDTKTDIFRSGPRKTEMSPEAIQAVRQKARSGGPPAELANGSST